MKQMDEVTMLMLKIVISVCVALIARYVLPYLKTLKENARYSRVIGVIECAVKAAEQTITDPKSGSLKKAKVLKSVKDWLGDHNIDISEQEIDDLIEAAVYAMKNKGE